MSWTVAATGHTCSHGAFSQCTQVTGCTRYASGFAAVPPLK